MKYNSFIFKDYSFSADTKELVLSYSYDDALEFRETYRFDFEFVDFDAAMLDRAIQLLFFVAGVSYYKAFVPLNLEVRKGEIDQQTAQFLQTTYQKGLGEFFYVNKLDPNTVITFPVTITEPLQPITQQTTSDKLLIGIGGGKDSLVTVEALRNLEDVRTWSLNHRSQLTPLIEKIGTKHLWVERAWDPQIQELNAQGAYNGHVPISAIIACVGTIVNILSGTSTHVVSNEQSANEPTLQYEGVAINHQYSKSEEFEVLYQNQLTHLFGNSLHYFSFLRSLSEVMVAKLFAQTAFEKYKDVFSSCNRAYTHDNNQMFWCGVCPKCAFVFLALTPFIERSKLEALWNGKNLLLDPDLENTYRQLLGIEGDKPLECVGEIKENRAAMKQAQAIYPELVKYSFELPDSYDYAKLGSHHMPAKYYAILTSLVGQQQPEPNE